MNATDSIRRARGAAMLALPVVVACLGLGQAAQAASRPVVSMMERRFEGLVKQSYDLSCGAAALATLLTYQHGIEASEREVALQLINRPEYLKQPEIVRIRQGFSLLDLKRVAARYGLEAQGLANMKHEELPGFAPLIVPLKTAQGNHFVIWRGEAAGRVLISDPAFGHRTMTREAFEEAWLVLPGRGHIGFAIKRPGTDYGTRGRLNAGLEDFWFFR